MARSAKHLLPTHQCLMLSFLVASRDSLAVDKYKGVYVLMVYSFVHLLSAFPRYAAICPLAYHVRAYARPACPEYICNLSEAVRPRFIFFPHSWAPHPHFLFPPAFVAVATLPFCKRIPGHRGPNLLASPVYAAHLRVRTRGI